MITSEPLNTSEYSVDIYPSSRIDEELLQDLVNICRLGEKGFRIPTDRETLYEVLEYPLDDEILKNIYISGFSTPLENLKVMMQLVDARREKAQVALPL
ncbi:putative mitochondrial intermediate peptidase [Trifolium medium]|uniref:Putative mitochondrial intermediate peptidase n=1 Tax=Trifolium medium TaxID=97028 RepID=A0A392LWM1_9FABA|nr:putative mitochondrial intermediate peptidase [Trifolium medium]